MGNCCRAEQDARRDLAGFFKFLFPALLLTLLSVVATLILKPAAWPVMAAFAAAWAVSPFVAYQSALCVCLNPSS